MRKTVTAIRLIAISLLLFVSCSKEEEEDFLPISKSIITKQSTTTSFTATLNGSFVDLDKMDIALGKSGVIYTVWTEDVELLFRAWLDGSDDPGCMIWDKSTVSSESVKCTLNGLSPDTEYCYCLFLQKRDGTRLIGPVSTFRTQPFSPDIKEMTINGIQCFVGFVNSGVTIDAKDAAYCEIGIIVSGQSNGNISNSTVYRKDALSDAANFKTRISGLESNKDYYCRLYVKYPISSDQYDYIYGPEKSFRTKDFQTVAVDMGLPSGTLWASYNVGAEKPEDYGDYFAWGEIEPKETYNWSTYKLKSGNNYSTKYCTDTLSSDVSKFQYIQLEDDAANYNWGGNWRIPSNEDLNELDYYCYNYVDTINGIIGATYVSEINGKTFFTPFAGVMHEKTLTGAGEFWLMFARDLYFYDHDGGFWRWRNMAEWNSWDEFDKQHSFYRYDGHIIRPVYPIQP